MILERIGKKAYRLDLSANKHQALQGLYDVFHASLLRRYQSNRLDCDAPPIEINSEEQYKVKAIQNHHVICGEMQFLVKWVGYNESENLWLTASQQDSMKGILEACQR